MSINELQDEVIAEFSDFDDWMDRYQLLIDLGNEQEPLEEKYKTEQNLIEGCQSRVWLQADDVDGKIVFKAESDALIVKGIIALLIKVLSGHTPDEILNTDLYFIDNYHNSVITAENKMNYIVDDGVHPNENGRFEIAIQIVNLLDEI